MFSSVTSAALCGIEACIVNVETDVGCGLPTFDMSGYLGSEVKEAKERVRIAIKNSAIELAPQRIVINISPADIRKEGTGFDLPIAVGILVSNGIIKESAIEDTLIIGELSLDGTVNPVNGVLPIVCAAKEAGIKLCIIPKANLTEGSIAQGIQLYGAESLKEVISILSGDSQYGVSANNSSDYNSENIDSICESEEDYLDIKGQYIAKRATLIAAAGMHNIMYIGPPGSGKTMLAKRIPTILPDMTYEEMLKVTKIYSVAGKLDATKGLITKRPFRSPHHTITSAAMLGGGRIPRPGEITLAGSGVLFLDEMTEFKPDLMESLRQPLEDKKITLVRLNAAFTYPAEFMLAAAINPCKCGYYPDRNRCHCSEYDIRRYIGRISNPMWDRFDMCVKVDEVTYSDIAGEYNVSDKYNERGDYNMLSECNETSENINADIYKEQDEYSSASGYEKLDEYRVTMEDNKLDRYNKRENYNTSNEGDTTNEYSIYTSAYMKLQVEKARSIQQKRFANSKTDYNSQMTMREIKKYCSLDKEAAEVMEAMYKKLSMSARGYGKVLKTARTIADLSGCENIQKGHITEALFYYRK